jgi:hypothetical protein
MLLRVMRGWAVGLMVGKVMMIGALEAHAGFFNTGHFVAPGNFAIGFEPELTFTNGAGLAANLRYTHGLTELNNLNFIIGTGGGPRRFRVGGNFTFDFFPDIDDQPGIGLAAQGIYYRVGTGDMTAGIFEVTGVPYIHKAFKTGGNEVEPFLAIPIGLGFSGGNYETVSQVVFGSMFQNTEHIRYSVEFGFNINHSESYMSGGVTYYH